MTTHSTTRTIRRKTSRRYDGLIALILLIIGLSGVIRIITTVPPIVGPVTGNPDDGANIARQFLAAPNTGAMALMLLAVCITILGAAWFVVHLLHWRFHAVSEPLKVWRQALWVALFVTLGAWLQLNRSLTFALALLMLATLAALEVYLNVRER